jgi:ABC-type molybdate transport system substrate-binding protein
MGLSVHRAGRFGLHLTFIGLVLWVVASPPAAAQMPPRRVFTTRAIRTVLDQVGPEFERASRRRLEVISYVAAPMVRRVRSGEPFDVLVAAPDQIDALADDGFILPATHQSRPVRHWRRRPRRRRHP